MSNLSEEEKKTLLENIDYWHKAYNDTFDELQREKENNKELQNYMKEYLIPKSTIKLVYISKDKIKELLEKYKNEHFIAKADIENLLKENNNE